MLYDHVEFLYDQLLIQYRKASMPYCYFHIKYLKKNEIKAVRYKQT